MPYELTDLTSYEIRVMARIANVIDAANDNGVEIEELTDWQIMAARKLIERGLARLHPGRDVTFWLRLTEEGRRVQKEGSTG